MSLDFHHTCPDIDSGISSAKQILKDHLDDIVSDLSGAFYSANGGKDKNEFIDNCVSNIYDDLESAFEGVRKTNEDMRSAADDQIRELQDKVEDLDCQVKDLEKEIEDLESRVE